MRLKVLASEAAVVRLPSAALSAADVGALASSALAGEALGEGSGSGSDKDGDAVSGEFFVSVSRSAEEFSLVVAHPLPAAVRSALDGLPAAVQQQLQVEAGWRCIGVAGPLDFALVGVLSALTGTLAAAKVPVFCVSTFDTDYILVKLDLLDSAVHALMADGHEVAGHSGAPEQASAPATSAAPAPATSVATVAGCRPFALERYFAKHEFNAPHLLCCSDCESLSMAELVAMADSECAALWRGLGLGYSESEGMHALRAEVAASYSGLAADDVTILCPEEAIFLTMQALDLGPEDEVVVPAPAYQSLLEFARARGCAIREWRATMDASGAWAFDVGELRALVGSKTRLVVTNFPHNPTGCLPTPAEWEVVVDVCRAAGCALFSDEMYRGLEPEEVGSLPAACEVYERAVTLCGVSKTLSCPGLRIGWVATKDAALASKVRTLRDYTTICSSAPSEVLALIALRNADAILARNRALMRRGLDALEAYFAPRSGRFLFARPRAGPIAFVKLLGGGQSEADSGSVSGSVSAEQFCDALVEKHGIVLLPGSVYPSAGGPGPLEQHGHAIAKDAIAKEVDHAGVVAQCMRFGFARANVPDIVERLAKLDES